eukprot:comp20903_c0_seq1/m.27833 comp20903_c0_seq1/g.27833  ORF comp20903_c0_seq1/g.27833 comp20903_c0_seq1/m.27833 type:complete len:245 (-) comp20903_c0_seq1:1331-2065(-)
MSGGFGGGLSAGVTSRSVQTTVMNGRQVRITRETVNGVETVKVEENGRLIKHTVNGVPQLVQGESAQQQSLPAPQTGELNQRRTSTNERGQAPQQIAGERKQLHTEEPVGGNVRIAGQSMTRGTGDKRPVAGDVRSMGGMQYQQPHTPTMTEHARRSSTASVDRVGSVASANRVGPAASVERTGPGQGMGESQMSSSGTVGHQGCMDREGLRPASEVPWWRRVARAVKSVICTRHHRARSSTEE